MIRANPAKAGDPKPRVLASFAKKRMTPRSTQDRRAAVTRERSVINKILTRVVGPMLFVTSRSYNKTIGANEFRKNVGERT